MRVVLAGVPTIVGGILGTDGGDDDVEFDELEEDGDIDELPTLLEEVIIEVFTLLDNDVLIFVLDGSTILSLTIPLVNFVASIQLQFDKPQEQTLEQVDSPCDDVDAGDDELIK